MTRKYTRKAPLTPKKTPHPLGSEWMLVVPRGSDLSVEMHIPNLIHVLRNPKMYDSRSFEEAVMNAALFIESTSGVAGFKSVISGPTIYWSEGK